MATFPRRNADGTTTGPAADPPITDVNDPGGAHTKGYSADPDPKPDAADLPDPIPLVEAPDEARIVPPQQTGLGQPTSGQGESVSNKERVMGSDR